MGYNPTSHNMASSFVRVCALVRNYPGIPWYLFQIPSNGLFGNVRLKRPRFGKKTTFCSMIFSMYCNFVDFWYFCFGCYCKFIFGHTTAGFLVCFRGRVMVWKWGHDVPLNYSMGISGTEKIGGTDSI